MTHKTQYKKDSYKKCESFLLPKHVPADVFTPIDPKHCELPDAILQTAEFRITSQGFKTNIGIYFDQRYLGCGRSKHVPADVLG